MEAQNKVLDTRWIIHDNLGADGGWLENHPRSHELEFFAFELLKQRKEKPVLLL